MKKKNGFTLVELLAVIVILAIILVIAVPQIVSTINNARLGALKSSAQLLAASAERDYLVKQTLGDTSWTALTSIPCTDVSDVDTTSSADYKTCTITMTDGKAKVTLEGKDGGKFSGRKCTDVTRDGKGTCA